MLQNRKQTLNLIGWQSDYTHAYVKNKLNKYFPVFQALKICVTNPNKCHLRNSQALYKLSCTQTEQATNTSALDTNLPSQEVSYKSRWQYHNMSKDWHVCSWLVKCGVTQESAIHCWWDEWESGMVAGAYNPSIGKLRWEDQYLKFMATGNYVAIPHLKKKKKNSNKTNKTNQQNRKQNKFQVNLDK